MKIYANIEGKERLITKVVFRNVGDTATCVYPVSDIKSIRIANEE